MQFTEKRKADTNTAPIYQMHKYWGKKPSEELKKIILAYSREGDTILDPFAGFGGFGIEGVLQNRKVIINDLNPTAVFIANNILNDKIDLKKFVLLFEKIKKEYEQCRIYWYTYNNKEVVTALRDSSDNVTKIKVMGEKGDSVICLSKVESDEFQNKENQAILKTWFPNERLITNARINAKEGMRTADLFPKRALICHSLLYDLINNLNDSPEKELLLFTFTSNLANCSKLVPPINSRGDMSQGAWMTGFYVGKTYLENNVFHYFENRIEKTIKGKRAFLNLLKENNIKPHLSILNEDAKKLSVQSNSVDLVFTDFPYGDTVPYFEQSQLWNHWLKFKVDFENEIVVSDSKERSKDFEDFDNGIKKSIQEIGRVLKDDKYFVFTFHSLSGKEWSSIVSSLKTNNFVFVDCEILIQKTFSPRQLNRANSIKGDVVAVYKKISGFAPKEKEFTTLLAIYISSESKQKTTFETNDLIILIVKAMLVANYTEDINFIKIMNEYFEYIEKDCVWRIRQ